MEKLCFLPKHPEIKMYQDTDMFCINTDTEVLGEFLDIKKTDNVLDIGTNNGALLLYASLFNPKSIEGLDINAKALPIAEKNLKMNNIENYKLINADIMSYKGELKDVIICNPPYFKTKEDNKADNEFKNLAKHEGHLTLEGLIKSISLNLKDSGRLFFLNLSSRLDEVLIELNKNNLTPKIIQFVHDENKDYSNVFMVKAVKNADQGLFVKSPIVISRSK